MAAASIQKKNNTENKDNINKIEKALKNAKQNTNRKTMLKNS